LLMLNVAPYALTSAWAKVAASKAMSRKCQKIPPCQFNLDSN
jgi:hypothetical protein